MSFFPNRFKIVNENGEIITSNNPFSIILRYFYEILWDSDVDFSKGTLTDVEVVDSGDSALLKLEANANNSDDIPFTTSGNYTYNESDIEVVAGKAQLKGSVSDSNNWSFTVAGNYTFDSAKIEVTGGVGKLKGTPVDPYVWYHLNESSGINCNDASTHNRDGTTKNMEDVDWVAGKLNNCLTFDGVDEYVDCGNIAQFERTDSFSIECWLKTTDVSCSVISCYSGSRGWDLYIASGGTVFFLLRNNTSGNQITRYSLSTVNSGSWNHIVITYDGSSTLTGLNIYVNGSLSNGTGTDALTASIVSGSNMNIGRRSSGGLLYSGDLDEIVIYDKELDVTDVLIRYNSGNGTESALGAYPLTDPNIYPDNGHVFTSEITTFTETSIKPVNTEIKYHISADNGVTWKYWNGSAWVVTDDSYTQANIGADVNSYIDQLASNGTFKFRALLHTSDELKTPELDNIYIGIVTYPTGGKEIEMNWDIQPTHVFEYLTTTETVSEPPNTDIKYKYSIDSGSSYNASWLTNVELQSALQGLSPLGDGTDKLRLKFQIYTSVANKTPQIDNLNIISDAGYKTSGEFESNIYDSNYYNLDWGIINFNIVLPGGCTLTIKARASNDSGDLGNYGGALSTGDDSNITGRYLQWKAEFTGDGASTPALDKISLQYSNPFRITYKP